MDGENAPTADVPDSLGTSSFLINKRAQRGGGAHDDAAVALFDEAPRRKPSQHDTDRAARQAGRACQVVLGDRNVGRLRDFWIGKTAPAQSQEHCGAAPLAVPDQKICGDIEADVAEEERGLEKKTATSRGAPGEAF